MNYEQHKIVSLSSLISDTYASVQAELFNRKKRGGVCPAVLLSIRSEFGVSANSEKLKN